MTHESIDQRTAWIDGELSPAESASFLAGLSEAERAALEAEKQLDSGIARLLGAEAPCPDAAWKRAAQAVYEAEAAATRARFNWRRSALLAAPLAAAVVIVFALLVPGYSDATPTFLKVAGATVPEMEQHAAVLSDHDQVEQFMRQYGFNVRLNEVAPPPPVAGERKSLRLLGAQAVEYRGETVILLLFACCGKPAQVVVTTRGGEAERAILAAQRRKAVEFTRELCPQYRGVVVGETDQATHMLSLLASYR